MKRRTHTASPPKAATSIRACVYLPVARGLDAGPYTLQQIDEIILPSLLRYAPTIEHADIVGSAQRAQPV